MAIKWFGIPVRMHEDPSLVSLANAMGESIPLTLGRVALVLGWMAEHEPIGVMPEAVMIGQAAQVRASKRLDFGREFIEAFGGQYGECVPYVKANTALSNNRHRQREKQRLRRLGGGD